MKKNFDEKFERLMTEQYAIPEPVKKRLNMTYDQIQEQSKRKKKKSTGLRITAAACTFLLAGGLLINEEVRASLNDFFSFQDKGIDKALLEGFGENNESAVTDQDVKITLTQHFSDANKLGMSFQFFFIDQTILVEDTTRVSIDYRLKNGDGEYIVESIPDTKTSKRDKIYTSGAETHFNIDTKNGVVLYDEVIDSSKGILPTLQDAVIEIESINFFSEATEKLQKVEGEWHLPLKNQNSHDVLFDYVAKKNHPTIELISAVASPTSLNMQLIVESEPFGPEGQFMWIVDEAGLEYETNGYHLNENDGKTTVDVNFPISAYENAKKLRLVIENMGELELRKE